MRQLKAIPKAQLLLKNVFIACINAKVMVDDHKSKKVTIRDNFLNLNVPEDKESSTLTLTAKESLKIQIHLDTGSKTITVPIIGLRRLHATLPERCQII